MANISEDELLKRLGALDVETLRFLSAYSHERRKLTRTSTIISSAIASVAGLALAVTALFPDFSFELTSSLSVVVGFATVWLGQLEREREESRLISRLLHESASEKNSENNTEKKRELIEKFLKAEGL